MKYVSEVDGLRGVAASGVVLFHLAPDNAFWMWSFVDLFFVLSGYLVTTILLHEYDAGNFSLKNFWMRRILRIWPVYFATLIGVAVLLVFWRGTAIGPTDFEEHFRLSALFLQFTPYYFLGNGDPWQPFEYIPSFFHSWSIAVEEQFYILWPLLLVGLLKLQNFRWAVSVCIILLGFSIYARFQLDWVPYLLLSRTDGLALGALLAVLLHRDRLSASSLRASWIFGLSMLLGLATAYPYLSYGFTYGYKPDEFFTRPFIITSFSLIYFGLLGYVIGSAGGRLFAFLRHPVLVYLGSISYAMYMFHPPIIFFIKPKIVYFLPSAIEILVYPIFIVVLLLSCHISMHYLERPVLALKRRFY